MRYIICYDITEQYIRNQVAKLLESKAHRLQYSVFMGDMSESACRSLRNELLELTKASEKKMLLITPLCAACADRLWLVGEPLEQKACCIVA